MLLKLETYAHRIVASSTVARVAVVAIVSVIAVVIAVAVGREGVG